MLLKVSPAAKLERYTLGRTGPSRGVVGSGLRSSPAQREFISWLGDLRVMLMIRRTLPGGLPRFSWVAFAVAGALSASGVVVAGSLVGPVAGTTPASTWLGVLSPVAVDPQRRPLPGLLLVAAIGALGLVWLVVLTGPWKWTVRQLWAMAACWSVPLVLGPPLLSDDVASYVAQGELSLRDLSPYANTPADLGPGPVLAAVDPIWRNVHSPYGPIATFIEHAAVLVAHGSPVGSVVLLRLVALASAAMIGLIAARLASPSFRQTALMLTVLNPLVLLHVVSAAHLDGLMCALVLAALLALRRDRCELALVLGCAAGLVKAPGFGVVAVVLVVMWGQVAAGRRIVMVARSAAVLVAASCGLSALVAHGWGWLAQLGTPALGFTPDAPSTAIALALHPVLVWTHVASAEHVALACKAGTLALAAVFVTHLLRTRARREPTLTIGWILLAVAVLGPVMYPWYLLWGVTCLAVHTAPSVRRTVTMVSFVGSFMAVQGLTRPGIAVLTCLLVSVLACGSVWILRSASSRSALRGTRGSSQRVVRHFARPAPRSRSPRRAAAR